MLDDDVLRIFEIIYNKQHSNATMKEIVQKVEEARNYLNEMNENKSEPLVEENIGEEELEEQRTLTRDDLLIKNPKKIRESIGDDTITCCICGKELKSLGAHLKRYHKITPDEYRKICDLPENTVLMSKNYYEKAQKYAMNAYNSLSQNRKNKKTDLQNDFDSLEADDVIEDSDLDIENLDFENSNDAKPYKSNLNNDYQGLEL